MLRWRKGHEECSFFVGPGEAFIRKNPLGSCPYGHHFRIADLQPAIRLTPRPVFRRRVPLAFAITKPRR